mmetsp:Transcript_14323/g.45270  ORF Transcript_14323/g.45270 Transcript_14323/m.45270 type:complete len:296 (+) Transcript_14323:50-937(+)
MTDSVGFIGLGIMGEGMAKCLLKSGRKLVVWNRSAGKCAALSADHPSAVTAVDSPSAVLAACDLVYCMLSTPDAVKAVYEMEGGVLAGVRAGTKLVDCATLAAEDMVRLEKQVTERGGRFLEAPVSGSKGPAASGQLIFLTAGDEPLYDEIKGTDLEAMGKASFFFGAPGKGARMKLVVNMVMGTMMASLGEGLALCGAAGMDCEQLLKVLDLGVMSNGMFRLKGPKMLQSDHAPNFPLQHAQKDMRLAGELGAQLGLGLPVAAATNAAMLAAREQGLSEEDFSSVYEAQKKTKP